MWGVTTTPIAYTGCPHGVMSLQLPAQGTENGALSQQGLHPHSLIPPPKEQPVQPLDLGGGSGGAESVREGLLRLPFSEVKT